MPRRRHAAWPVHRPARIAPISAFARSTHPPATPATGPQRAPPRPPRCRTGPVRSALYSPPDRAPAPAPHRLVPRHVCPAVRQRTPSPQRPLPIADRAAPPAQSFPPPAPANCRSPAPPPARATPPHCRGPGGSRRRKSAPPPPAALPSAAPHRAPSAGTHRRGRARWPGQSGHGPRHNPPPLPSPRPQGSAASAQPPPAPTPPPPAAPRPQCRARQAQHQWQSGSQLRSCPPATANHAPGLLGSGTPPCPNPTDPA